MSPDLTFTRAASSPYIPWHTCPRWLPGWALVPWSPPDHRWSQLCALWASGYGGSMWHDKDREELIKVPVSEWAQPFGKYEITGAPWELDNPSKSLKASWLQWPRGEKALDFTFTFVHWRRKWQPTPVFLPGESQGRGSLVGCRLWGRTESDTTEAT